MDRHDQVKLRVAIDSGSHYFFDSDVDLLLSSLEERFSHLQKERLFFAHSWGAGTTIQLIIEGLAVGTGIVAAEIAKEVGKDLWHSVKRLVRKPEDTSRPLVGGSDRVVIALPIEGTQIRGTIELSRKYSHAIVNAMQQARLASMSQLFEAELKQIGMRIEGPVERESTYEDLNSDIDKLRKQIEQIGEFLDESDWGAKEERLLESFFVMGLPRLVELALDIQEGKGIPGNPTDTSPSVESAIEFDFVSGDWKFKRSSLTKHD